MTLPSAETTKDSAVPTTGAVGTKSRPGKTDSPNPLRNHRARCAPGASLRDDLCAGCEGGAPPGSVFEKKEKPAGEAEGLPPRSRAAPPPLKAWEEGLAGGRLSK